MGDEDGEVGTRGRRDLAMATWGLFVGLAFLMFAAGLFGTLLGVRAELAKLPTLVSSIISASYYAGFLIGSRLTLTYLARVGHIRVFAALSSLLAATVIAIGVTQSAGAWAVLRFATGLCIAGQYVVAESWLNDLATNDNRGRLLGLYSVITIALWGAGQALFFLFDPRLVMGFAVASIVVSIGVIPVTLSESADAPAVGEHEKLSLRELAKIVPTGVGSCFIVGLAHGAINGMAALYATRVGLSSVVTGLFVALPSLGGVLLQWPIGAASDDVDRRAVGLAASLGAAGCGALLLLGATDRPMALVLMTLLGGLTYPLYTIAGAYTNDWVDPEHVNAAAGKLIMLYGLGALAGPFVAAGSMVVAGPKGYFLAVIGIHALLAAFFAYRMRAWRSPLVKGPWSEVSLPARVFFVPSTVVAFGRRLRR